MVFKEIITDKKYLHDDRELFSNIIEYISNKTEIRKDIIEKDYYVTMLLSEIASKQKDITMYFKGGTALYKISNEMRRFSEDIDLTVKVQGLSNSQAKRMLERSTQAFETISRIKGDEMKENKRGSITCVYGYNSLYEIPTDKLQRFGKVKVEATSFTISDPIKTYTITPLIYQFSDDILKAKLLEYNCGSFSIMTISLERMFADKLLAAEFYLQRGLYNDVAKHIYDINHLMAFSEIQNMLKDDELLIKSFSYKRVEEIKRIGSNLKDYPLSDLTIFKAFENENVREYIENAYNQMCDIYIFQDKFKTPFSEIEKTFDSLKPIIDRINKKEQDYIHSDEFIYLCEQYGISNVLDTENDESLENSQSIKYNI